MYFFFEKDFNKKQSLDSGFNLIGKNNIKPKL